jgi:hypothetical protein
MKKDCAVSRWPITQARAGLFDAAVAETPRSPWPRTLRPALGSKSYEPVLLATQQRLVRLADHRSGSRQAADSRHLVGACGCARVLAVAETLAIRYPTEPDGHLLLGIAY